jgi:hypothetical protein
MNSQPHIRLFDQVEIALNVVGSKFKPSVEPDGTIHFAVTNVQGDVITNGRVTFNVFWANQRQNRALFDREILEQLIIKRVQDYQNEHSLVPIRIERVELDEVRELQTEAASQNFVDQLLEQAQRDLGPLTELGHLGMFCASIRPDNVYAHTVSKPDAFPTEGFAFSNVAPIDSLRVNANNEVTLQTEDPQEDLTSYSLLGLIPTQQAAAWGEGTDRFALVVSTAYTAALSRSPTDIAALDEVLQPFEPFTVTPKNTSGFSISVPLAGVRLTNGQFIAALPEIHFIDIASTHRPTPVTLNA